MAWEEFQYTHMIGFMRASENNEARKLCLLCVRTVLSILTHLILRTMLWGVVILIILYKMVLEEPSGPPERVKHI